MVLDGIDGARVSPLLDSAGLSDTESRRLAARAVAGKLAGGPDSRVSLDLVDAQGRPKHVEVERSDPDGKTVVFGNLPETPAGV
jgi:hypothetical protein